MRKIELTRHEKQLVIENSSKTSDLLTTLVSILVTRTQENTARDDPAWQVAHEKLQELGSRITALQRCEMSPVESTGLDYVRDMISVLQLPRVVGEYFHICKTDTEIDLSLSEQVSASNIHLARRFDNFSLKSGITITITIKHECA